MHGSTIFLFLIIIGLGIAFYFIYQKLKKIELENSKTCAQLKKYEAKYSKIIDVDNEVDKSLKHKNQLISDIQSLQSDYQKKYGLFQNLTRKIAIYDEDLELAEIGFYKPHFDFGTSEEYKKKIQSIREQQKAMLKAKTAVTCPTEWTVGDSKVEGKKMVNRAIKLTTRAFNNECEATIANVRWNNVEKMEERISKAAVDINKMNESNHVYIDQKYIELKMKELWLAYEYQEKLKEEKEEQAEIRRQMREEAKLEQEMLAAQKEEEKFQKLLRRAQAEAAKAAGENLEKLNYEIAELTQKLAEAHQKNERALSMAQQTKAGHVYIISNIGSFGENIYKIGMTRRLEPMDRVHELGDASVPFYFDVHAMIYSDNAPAMENALHKAFADRRLNLVNLRKEFFHVTLNEIQNEVFKIANDAEFILTAEAEEFRQSQMIRHEKTQAEKKLEEEIPSVI
ncbi:DUF4041 domain-containing protein [Acinetobacter pittii]|uniref:DUF4041 domain-containing protein n=1 Tax=Acinetobacter pittii TaxID=48296 RepID=UPI00062AA0F3|nr:DUF4041 domain-containing protein [Acinetobacter pittii]TGU85321.1 DUF4041 domain-containing protein [Acinetobacter pittii]